MDTNVKIAKSSGDAYNWEKKLDRISITNIHEMRKCHILIVVEKTTTDLEKLLMIRYHSESNSHNLLKFISMNDIYDFIISYETKKMYVDETVMKIIRGACNDARRYLQKGKDLPHELLGKIIKLKILTIVTVDVHQRRQDFMHATAYVDKLKLTSHFDSAKRRKRREMLKDPFRELYILLIQFYSPKIISGCCRCGITISGIVEFGEKDKEGIEYPAERHNSDIFREEFWKKAPKVYYRQQRLEEPFRLVYRPAPFKIFKGNPHIYTNQCYKLYEDFAKSIDIDTINNMKHRFLQFFDIEKLLKAEVVKSDRADENAEESEFNPIHYPIFSNMSTLVPASAAATSTTIEWVRNNRPRIRRVNNELDIDGRMRFSKWPATQ